MSEEKNPTEFNRPDWDILVSADLDGLGQAIITLTKEIWVLTDRLHVMEAVMADNGMDISEQIKNYQPSEALQAKLNSESQTLVEKVLTSIAG
jgi:hypothetical protein